MNKTAQPSCPLCLAPESTVFHEKEDPRLGLRRYWKCRRCRLVYLSREQCLSIEDQKERYDAHRNSPGDPDYVQFLERLVDPLSVRLAKGAEGLDFGCGPGPALSVIMKTRGFRVSNYDPIYYPDEDLLRRCYDFVACTEVIEHFDHPRREFLTLDRLIDSRGGFLGVMTQVLDDEKKFADWWYHRDPTHTVFYQEATLRWIAAWRHWKIIPSVKNVTIFSRLS